MSTTTLAVSNGFEMMMEEAETLVKSGFLPKAIKTAPQALAIMTMSKELGIGYWTGFNGINVIGGKPTISPQLMLALIYKRHPEAVIQINGDNKSCRVFMQRRDGQAHEEVFTIEQAAQIMTREDDKTIPLTQKYNWRQQPAVMLKWRAVAACARVIFPDVIMGFYTPEEIEPSVAVDFETGELVPEHPALEAEIVQTAPVASPAPAGTTQDDEPKRPYTPNVLRALMVVHVQDFPGSNNVLDRKGVQAAQIAWKGKFGGLADTEDKRHLVVRFLFGILSFNTLTDAMVSAIKWWVADVPMARLECQAIITAFETGEIWFEEDERGEPEAA